MIAYRVEYDSALCNGTRTAAYFRTYQEAKRHGTIFANWEITAVVIH